MGDKKAWTKANPERARLLWRRGHIKNRDKRNAARRERGRDLRAERKRLVLTRYGRGELKCVRCPVTDIDVLTIDHIADNGADERRKLGIEGGGGEKFYRYLIEREFPEGYQTLCMNCQTKKKIAPIFDDCQGGLWSVA